MAMRTAISRRRALARPSKRLATLTHAMASTNQAAPNNTSNDRLTRGSTRRASSGDARTSHLSLPIRFGNSFAARPPSVDISSVACNSVTPRARRATIDSMDVPGRSSSAATVVTGRNTSASPDSPRNSRGVTPMIVHGSRSMSMTRPMADGSALNRRCQSPYEMITSCGAPTCASSARSKSRPRAGARPSVRRYEALTYSPRTRSTSPLVNVARAEE